MSSLVLPFQRLSRFFKGFSAIAAVALTLLAWPQAAVAAPFLQLAGGCYDVATHGYVSSTFCQKNSGTYYSASAAKALADTLMGIPAGPVEPEAFTDTASCAREGEGGVEDQDVYHFSSQPTLVVDACADGGLYSWNPMVKPSGRGVANSDWNVSAFYSRQSVAAGSSLLAGEQKIQNATVVLSLARDFGDWGYTIVAPLTRSVSEGAYSSLNNTRLDLSFAPVYHLLREQVHGVSVDVGGRAGYSHAWFDTAAVRAAMGGAGFGSFENTRTLHAGLTTRLDKALGLNTRATVQAEWLGFRHIQNDAALGDSVSVLVTSMALSHRLSEKATLTGQLQTMRIRQPFFDSVINLTDVGVGADLKLDRRSSVQFMFQRDVSSGPLSGAQLWMNYNWQWN